MAIAVAQAASGVISDAAANDIVRAGERLLERDDVPLWSAAANVGYPILPLVRILDAETELDGSGRVHLGATTQDIMDSALAIQMGRASDILLRHLTRLGDGLASLIETHAQTSMAGRTHAQQAVPTTFGLKLAVYLHQVRRIAARIAIDKSDVATVSLFGAAGTSAALAHADAVRTRMADLLNLSDAHVPWHVARDGLFHQAANAVVAAEIASRLAREVIDLSRTEIREVTEVSGPHRGASSTMPQKANPILSEAIVGLAVTASSLLPAMARAVEAGHERAAGEWQVEWHVLPQLFTLASSALLRAVELVDGLEVDNQAMVKNMEADHGLLMAEAYMMALSPFVGREEAHHEVYGACLDARENKLPLEEALAKRLPEHLIITLSETKPNDYVGNAEGVCSRIVDEWRTARLKGEFL